jgi:hypothetical protein
MYAYLYQNTNTIYILHRLTVTMKFPCSPQNNYQFHEGMLNPEDLVFAFAAKSKAEQQSKNLAEMFTILFLEGTEAQNNVVCANALEWHCDRNKMFSFRISNSERKFIIRKGLVS